MKKSIIFLLVLVIIASNISLVASSDNIITTISKTIYVDDDADPSWYDATHVRTISEGINNTSNGDMVYVYNGTYYEHIVINKSIDLIGEKKELVIINGTRSGDIIQINSDRVNINGFTLKNSGPLENFDSVIEVYSKYNNVSGNIISCDMGSMYNPVAVYLKSNADNNKITNNQINNSGDAAIFIDSSNNQIIGNAFTDCGGRFIWIYPSYGEVSNNTIMSNIFFDKGIMKGWGVAIEVWNSMENIIMNNTIKDQAGGISLYGANKNIISGNKISNNVNYGIGIASSSYNKISLNHVSNNHIGICLDYHPNNNNEIYHNNLIDNGYNAYARRCFRIKWIGNYWSDWIGHKSKFLRFLPHPIIKGTTRFGNFRMFRLLPSNFDMHPALEPYDI